MDTFIGKICVVTGSGSGIGKAITELLLQLGATVYAIDINEEGLANIAWHGDLTLLHKTRIDITDESAVSDHLSLVVQQSGVIDYLFNIAGIAMVGEAHDLSRDNWRKIIDVNLNGVINTTVYTYQQMVRQGLMFPHFTGHLVKHFLAQTALVFYTQ